MSKLLNYGFVRYNYKLLIAKAALHYITCLVYMYVAIQLLSSLFYTHGDTDAHIQTIILC